MGLATFLSKMGESARIEVEMHYFEKIIGQESIISHFQNAIRLQKISHAYILDGEDGAGKNMLARAFATALQCEQGGLTACGTCKSCLQAVSANHPDIIFVTHQKAKIGVDDIRLQLNRDIQIKPYSSKYKIYIIDEAEKMTEQAQNALLKTIEEPPEYGVVLLLTNNSKIFLQTILSRCVCLTLKPVEQEKIKEFLLLQSIPEYHAELSAAFSCGNIGKALRFATSDSFFEMKQDVVHLMKHIKDLTIRDLIDAMKHFSEKKSDIYDYLDLMKLWFRDVLMFKATKNANMMLFSDEISAIRKQADVRTFENLNNLQTAFEKAELRLKANVNFEITMELLMLNILELE